MFENGEEKDGFSLQPQSLMLLDCLSFHNLSICALFLGQFSCFGEDIDEVAFELLYLLEVALNVSRDSIEVPEFLLNGLCFLPLLFFFLLCSDPVRLLAASQYSLIS
jgi:hypothetical protein